MLEGFENPPQEDAPDFFTVPNSIKGAVKDCRHELLLNMRAVIPAILERLEREGLKTASNRGVKEVALQALELAQAMNDMVDDWAQGYYTDLRTERAELLGVGKPCDAE